MKKITIIILMISLAFASYAKEPQRGYRGFIELDNSIGTMDYFDNTDGQTKRDTQWFLGIATSHGYQFNNHIYAGAGLMVSAATPSGDMMLPIFADIRYDYAMNKFTPFADLRAGFNFCDGGGIYLSPTIGYRLNWGRKVNMNIGLGLTLRGKSIRQYCLVAEPIEDSEEFDYYVTYLGKKHHADALLSLRFGIDF